MRIVYGAPPGAGWHPITHMVRLLAELLSAELVIVSVTRPAKAIRRVAARAPRRRGRGTCLVVAAAPRHLASLAEPGYWARGYGHVAGWVIDSFWIEYLPDVPSHHFDQLFVADKEVAGQWASATGVPVSWLPWGSDVLRLGSAEAERAIDLQRLGREPEQWEDDDEVKRACAEAGLRFEGRPPMHDDASSNEQSLMARLSKAKFTLAFTNAVSPASYTHPSREYLTGRWTDALASGSVVAGIAPACEATAVLLWPEATLDLGTVDRASGIGRIVEAVSRWTPEAARHNHREALRRLDWRWRFEELAHAMGLESEPLDRELDALRVAVDASTTS